MTLQLAEGQDFAAHYSLLQRLHQSERVENWLALDKELSERVMLRVFTTPIAENVRVELASAIKAARGLVHPGIARVYASDTFEGYDFVASQFVRAARPFLPAPESLQRQWPAFEQIFEALGYAHGLGIAHGHLHPGNLLQDDQGTVHITDFGLPDNLQNDKNHEGFLSPQVRNGQHADPSDDIYSLGQLIFVGLTGRQWRNEQAFESDSPIPETLSNLTRSMLKESAYERPRDLKLVRETLQHYVFGDADAPLDTITTNFSRSRPVISDSPIPSNFHRPARESSQIPASVAYGGFGLLIAIGLLVFFLLPSLAPAPTTTGQIAHDQPGNVATTAGTLSNATPETKPPALTPLEIAKQKQQEADGTRLAKELLRLQVELEDMGVQIWEPVRYREATDLAAEADSSYRDKEFETALGQYQGAIDILTVLKAQATLTLESNLAIGNTAFDAGDAATAIRAYTIAVSIDPTNKVARQQLARAENLDQVIEKVQQSAFLESEGDLDAALLSASEALSLDPRWQDAINARQRIRDKIAKRRFRDVMSDAMTALGNEQYDEARAGFERARRILPDSLEPNDGLEQVGIAIQQKEINHHLDAASRAMVAENFAEAVTEYQAVLNLDPTIVAAIDGLATAKSRTSLDESLLNYVSNPALLSDDDELSKAKRLLVEATRVSPKGSRIEKQMNQLSNYIAYARIPVSVEIRSDDRTDVTVYRVRNLGRIDSVSLDLIPGSYTIVGKRPGYREVQHKLTLLGGQKVAPIYISCTEKI